MSGSTRKAESAPPPVTLLGTAVHHVRSKHIPEALRIEIGLPCAHETAGGEYPTIYLIDGYWYFPEVFAAVASMAMTGEMPPALVVGLGYERLTRDREAEDHRAMQLRYRDLTPTHDFSEWWRIAGASEPLAAHGETGRSAHFLRAIEEDVKQLVRSLYRVRAADEVLAGFSLGGLFALEVLMRNPLCFRRYVSGSPALWWQQGVMFEWEAEVAARGRDLAGDLFVSVGELESCGSGERARMVENVRRLESIVSQRHYPNLRSVFRVFKGDTHATAAAPAFAQGLKAVFGTRGDD